MAVYDPAEPMWKRNLAGILDFLLVFFTLGFLLSKIFGNISSPPSAATDAASISFDLGPWPSLLLVVLVVAYFVVLGRTGGTVFQRLFGMKRAKVMPARDVAAPSAG